MTGQQLRAWRKRLFGDDKNAQKLFGKFLGYKKSTIIAFETGHRKISKRVVKFYKENA